MRGKPCRKSKNKISHKSTTVHSPVSCAPPAPPTTMKQNYVYASFLLCVANSCKLIGWNFWRSVVWAREKPSLITAQLEYQSLIIQSDLISSLAQSPDCHLGLPSKSRPSEAPGCSPLGAAPEPQLFSICGLELRAMCPQHPTGRGQLLGTLWFKEEDGKKELASPGLFWNPSGNIGALG